MKNMAKGANLALLLMPIVIWGAAGGLLIPKFHTLRSDKIALKQTRLQEANVNQMLQQAAQVKPPKQIPCVPNGPQEQTNFLRDLNTLLKETNNRLVSIRSIVILPPAPKGGAPQQPKNQNALPDNVLPIQSTLIVHGNFHALLLLLSGLQNYPRMITISDCHISPTQGNHPDLQTTLTITRYVESDTVAAGSGNTTS